MISEEGVCDTLKENRLRDVKISEVAINFILKVKFIIKTHTSIDSFREQFS